MRVMPSSPNRSYERISLKDGEGPETCSNLISLIIRKKRSLKRKCILKRFGANNGVVGVVRSEVLMSRPFFLWCVRGVGARA